MKVILTCVNLFCRFRRFACYQIFQKMVNKNIDNPHALDIQIPCEYKHLNPQTYPEVRLLNVPNTDPHVRYDWRMAWMSRDI